MVSKKHSEWEKLHLNLMQAMMLIKEHVLIKSPFGKLLNQGQNLPLHETEGRKRKLVGVHKRIGDWTSFSQQFPQIFHSKFIALANRLLIVLFYMAT